MSKPTRITEILDADGVMVGFIRANEVVSANLEGHNGRLIAIRYLSDPTQKVVCVVPKGTSERGLLRALMIDVSYT